MLIATWNVQNLFRPGTADGAPRTQADYDTKVAGLAGTVRDAGVDVVAVQEVGAPEPFDDLRVALGDGWTGVLSTEPDAHRGIRVGVLARLPLQRVRDDVLLRRGLPPLYVDDTREVMPRMARGALTVAVTAQSGATVTLLTCHLKSKLVSYPGGRFDTSDEGERARFAAYGLVQRTYEAYTLRGLVDGLLAGHGQQQPVVLLGDCNDEPQAATNQILLGPSGSQFGTPGATVPDRGDAYRLFNPYPLLPPDEAYTRVDSGRRELIDQIMVSRALLEKVTAMHTVHGAPLPSVELVAQQVTAKPFSDHAMLVATVEV